MERGLARAWPIQVAVMLSLLLRRGVAGLCYDSVGSKEEEGMRRPGSSLQKPKV